MIRRLVLFGASGDLAFRHLLPALAGLRDAGHLPEGLRVRGAARQEWDTDGYRRRAEEALERHAPGTAPAARRAVVEALDYAVADVSDPDAVARAVGAEDGPAVAYLALPPSLFAPAVESLAAAGLAPGSRVVVEKPFGVDLASAAALNRLLHDAFPEEVVFRVDHFLAKQTVQNVVGLRFANRILEPVWNALHVEAVDVVWDETLALEGRAGYYDRTGALRDMVQNHLLQLLCLVAMEPPATLGARDLRDRKVEVLRAVRRMSPEEVGRRTRRARYGAGRVDGRAVPAYVDEEGVDPANGTETFARVVLHVENWRWAGVPFTLRSGKALGAERKEVIVRFRPVPHLAFGQDAQPGADVLRLGLDPDRLGLELAVNGPGEPFSLGRAELTATLAPQEVPAYGRLLLDVFEGDPTLSVRDDEAEESWRIVEPILDAWAAGRAPLEEYPAGSGGPPGA